MTRERERESLLYLKWSSVLYCDKNEAQRRRKRGRGGRGRDRVTNSQNSHRQENYNKMKSINKSMTCVLSILNHCYPNFLKKGRSKSRTRPSVMAIIR